MSELKDVLLGQMDKSLEKYRDIYGAYQRSRSERVSDIPEARQLMLEINVIESALRTLGCSRRQLEPLDHAWRFLAAHT